MPPHFAGVDFVVIQNQYPVTLPSLILSVLQMHPSGYRIRDGMGRYKTL